MDDASRNGRARLVGGPRSRGAQQYRLLRSSRPYERLPHSNFDFEVEAAGQFGRVGGSDVGAGMFTGVLGYTLSVKTLSPHVYLEFDYASGDRKTGGHVSTLMPLSESPETP